MKKFLRLRLILPSVLLIIGISLYAGRNYFLHYYLDKFSASFYKKRNARLVISYANLSGMDKMQLSGISLAPEGGDTLMKIRQVDVDINIFSMFFGKPVIRELHVQDAEVRAIRKDGKDNFSFLWKNGSEKKDTVVSGFGLSASRIVKTFFHSFPTTLHADKLDFIYSDEKIEMKASAPFMRSEGDLFSAEIVFEENNRSSSLSLSGEMDREKMSASLNIINKVRSGPVFPILQSRYNTALTFDTIHFSLDSSGMEDGVFYMKGNSFASRMSISNPKLSPSPVFLEDQHINYSVEIGENYFRLDSSSIAGINKISFSPYFQYTHTPEKRVELKINSAKIDANDFFSSLPPGLFNQTKDIVAEGSLSYSLNLAFDLPAPDSVVFQSSLKKDSFHVRPSSVAFITRVNEPFVHTVYEKGSPERVIIVSPENPDFVPLMKISELLKNCILTSEDGMFFYHRGFNEEMFAKAIRDNILKKRFARGASTITMQTVKNVFLRRDKTVSRKMEEALLVWMIENNHLVSKERLFEIYLNIIEWGPGIYGVAEASRFYFNKKPADLSLEECIFLTSIIPNPKMFRYSFDKSGQLKGNLSNYYKLISGILHYHQVITDEEYNQLKPSVNITGKARNFILPADSIPRDTLFNEE